MEEMQRLFVVLIAAWLCFGVLETVFGPEDEGLGVLSGLCLKWQACFIALSVLYWERSFGALLYSA